jgi:hypothetical protein
LYGALDTEQPFDGGAHARAQLFDISQALGSGEHRSDGRAQQRSQVPAFAAVVAVIGDLVEPGLV